MLQLLMPIHRSQLLQMNYLLLPLQIHHLLPRLPPNYVGYPKRYWETVKGCCL
jgi:hypothetical protein